MTKQMQRTTDPELAAVDEAEQIYGRQQARDWTLHACNDQWEQHNTTTRIGLAKNS